MSENSLNSTQLNEMKMSIHTGMLESLGSNMYNSVAKSLVEFIANSFDADATVVNVSLPYQEIENEREKCKPFSSTNILLLPEAITISVTDNGHGMNPQEIEDKFLVVNRHRRNNGDSKSENGKRKVMGRKGLGKLAGFGIAEKITIKSKRKNEDFWTTIEMDYSDIKQKEDIKNVMFIPKYEPSTDLKESGTTITLSKLRVHSFRSNFESVKDMIVRNFYIMGQDFKININDKKLEPPNIEYDFTYPNENERNSNNGWGKCEVTCDDGKSYTFKYLITFRKPGEHVPAAHRGARIYCNERLAAGPSLLNLPTGMHNFHAQSYIECSIHANFLDEQQIDLIGTNRSALQNDHYLVSAFIDKVTELMKQAIQEQGKHREQQVEQELLQNKETQILLNIVGTLSKKNRIPAQKLLKSLAKNVKISDPTFIQTATNLISAINSTPIIMKLLDEGNNISDIKELSRYLSELSKIEKNDLWKLFRARRGSIQKLHDLHIRSSNKKDPKFEKEFHQLLKESPWLINPEYNSYISSNKSIHSIIELLYKEINIPSDISTDCKDGKRPDLVFLVATYPLPTSVAVVELKSPNIALKYDNLNQLKLYMAKIELYLKRKYPKETTKVTGHLIGNSIGTDEEAILLEKEIEEAGPQTMWEVITISELISRTEKVHKLSLDALESDES